MNRDDRCRQVTFAQGNSGWECVICLANDYGTGDGRIVHKRGCDEIMVYVKHVRLGLGFHPPVHERVVVVGDQMGKGPGGQSGGYGGGQGYPNG